MPDHLMVYGLLVVAVGIGFLLGRREWRARRGRSTPVPRDYFAGLNHLLNERPELAIDTFLDVLEVNEATIDTHLALGSLVRRRGEVDKSIRIHQNILATGALAAEHRLRAEIELARDFLAAGLLDRAEKALMSLAERSGRQRSVVEHYLLDIYERERDWEAAVVVARSLAARDRQQRGVLGHLECEAAEQQLAEGDLAGARKSLKRAEDADPRSARPALILARLEFEARRYRETLRCLERAIDRDPTLAPETLALCHRAALELGEEGAYTRYLERCLKSHPTVEVLIEAAERKRRLEGDAAGRALVAAELTRRPTLATLGLLLEMDGNTSAEDGRADVFAAAVERLGLKRPLYRCGNCGFSARSLLWQCPSCRTWGKVHRTDDRGQMPEGTN